jgi:hypothetical protein
VGGGGRGAEPFAVPNMYTVRVQYMFHMYVFLGMVALFKNHDLFYRGEGIREPFSFLFVFAWFCVIPSGVYFPQILVHCHVQQDLPSFSITL